MSGKKAQDYSFDEFSPRQNDGADLDDDHRIVRNDEILSILEEGAVVG